MSCFSRHPITFHSMTANRHCSHLLIKMGQAFSEENQMMEEKSHYVRLIVLCMISNMSEITKFKYLPIFRDISVDELERIGALFDIKNMTAGETIFHQGDKAENLFILLTGKVSIRYKPYDGPPINISSIIPGWVFGWSAALGRETYTSEALALLPGSAFCLSKRHLLEICNLHDEAGIIFLDHLTIVIAERLNQTPKQVLSVLAKMADQTEG